MDDLESQTQQVGPSSSNQNYLKQKNMKQYERIIQNNGNNKEFQNIQEAQNDNLEKMFIYLLSVGTYVSIKKNKQTLLRMYEKIHSNHEAYKKNQNGQNAENIHEVKSLIKGIVELIENSTQYESAELMRICVFMSNMILCVDSDYRDDFIAFSKNIFQVLGQYFSQLNEISSCNSNFETVSNNNSQNHEYQTLALIYKLLMATRHPSETICAPKKGSTATLSPSDIQKEKNNIIIMREKLLSKDFMKKIFEIDVEEFAPNKNMIPEMWKMLLAFYTLFAKSKDRIAQLGLVRNAKDKFLEAIYLLHQLSKSDIQTLHQAVGCLNFTLDKIKLSLKEIQKYNLVPVLCDLLENPRTQTKQVQVILKMFLNLSKQNLLSKNSYQTMCLGKAFKVFELAPANAAELIADIYNKDPIALKDITIQSSVALLQGSNQHQQFQQFQQLKQQNQQSQLTISNNFPCQSQLSRQQIFLNNLYNIQQNQNLLNQFSAIRNSRLSYPPHQNSSGPSTSIYSSPSSSPLNYSADQSSSLFSKGIQSSIPQSCGQYANYNNLLLQQNMQAMNNNILAEKQWE